MALWTITVLLQSILFSILPDNHPEEEKKKKNKHKKPLVIADTKLREKELRLNYFLTNELHSIQFASQNRLFQQNDALLDKRFGCQNENINKIRIKSIKTHVHTKTDTAIRHEHNQLYNSDISNKKKRTHWILDGKLANTEVNMALCLCIGRK